MPPAESSGPYTQRLSLVSHYFLFSFHYGPSEPVFIGVMWSLLTKRSPQHVLFTGVNPIKVE